MVNPAELFPSEVWNHVFSHLSAAEKSCVRASCTYFRKLIDHPSLWRNWSVVLDFKKGRFDTYFWRTLRMRKVTSVELIDCNSEHVRVVASELPAVTTVVMGGRDLAFSQCLDAFKNLKSLTIKNTCMFDMNSISTEPPRLQLTHLSLCISMIEHISVVRQFKNLTSLVVHKKHGGTSFSQAAAILAALPNLKHLSLHVYFSTTHQDRPLVLEPNASQLTSLEIFVRGHFHPENALKGMSQLKRFAIFYTDVSRKALRNEPLSRWLGDLCDLSTLVMVRGPPVKTYVSSLPATLTDLTLQDPSVSLEDMAALAARVPRLQRLHLDTWPSPLGAKASQIPKLFPNLKSLRIRHEHIPEKNFLDLHQLQDLELLEVVDSHPDLPALVRRLRILTKYRVRVLTPPYQRDALSCPCVLDHQQDQRSELARRCSCRKTGVKLVPLVPFI